MIQKWKIFIKSRPYLSVLIAVSIIVAAYFFYPLKVEMGERVVCRYGEIITDKTKTSIVPRIFAGKYRVEETETICEKHKKAEKLYREAQKDLKEGKKEEAEEKLKILAKTDPGFKPVKPSTPKKTETGGTDIPAATDEQSTDSPESTPSGVEETGETTEEAGTSSGSSGSSRDSSGGEIVPGMMMELIPSEIDGYTLFLENDDLVAASRTFQPESTSTNVIILTVYVEHFGTNEKANEQLDKELGDEDSGNWEEVQIGSKSCRYFNNEKDRIIVAWAGDGIIHEIETYSISDPGDSYGDVALVVELMD